MIAKTPSLNASIREVGISPTLKILGNQFCRLLLYSPSAGQVNVRARLGASFSKPAVSKCGLKNCNADWRERHLYLEPSFMKIAICSNRAGCKLGCAGSEVRFYKAPICPECGQPLMYVSDSGISKRGQTL